MNGFYDSDKMKAINDQEQISAQLAQKVYKQMFENETQCS